LARPWVSPYQGEMRLAIFNRKRKASAGDDNPQPSRPHRCAQVCGRVQAVCHRKLDGIRLRFQPRRMAINANEPLSLSLVSTQIPPSSESPSLPIPIQKEPRIPTQITPSPESSSAPSEQEPARQPRASTEWAAPGSSGGDVPSLCNQRIQHQLRFSGNSCWSEVSEIIITLSTDHQQPTKRSPRVDPWTP
jgi:hypothetical protein